VTTAVSGIVLAGGRSSRFGADKLSAELEGRTLLDRSIQAVAAVASEVIVVTAKGDVRVLPPLSIPIRPVEDREPFGGPLVGLRGALGEVREPIVLVVAGDMPSIVPEVLTALVRTLAASPSSAAAALKSRGSLIPLPAVLRTGAASDVANRLVEDGERRLRALFERLPTRLLDEVEWRSLDPDGLTLRDVDVPGDLLRPPGTAP
jgi:molybdenum cofactor guanylyltransferase